MPYIVTPVIFGGGEKISPSGFNQNMTAYASGLTDGTKDIRINDVTVATNVTAAMANIDTNITISGAAAGEVMDIPLMNEAGNTTSTPTSVYLFRGGPVPNGTYGQYMQRAGSLVGWGIQYTATCIGFSDADNTTTVSPMIHLSGTTLVQGGSTSVTGSVVSSKSMTSWYTYGRGSYTFASGSVLGVNMHYTTSTGTATLNETIIIVAQVQYDT